MRGETISGIHKGTQTGPDDDFGNPTWTADVPFTIKRCLLAPSGNASSGSSETAEPFGAFVVSQVQVIVLRGQPDVRSDDKFTFWGYSGWQMQGELGPWRKGRLFGSVFMVKRAS